MTMLHYGTGPGVGTGGMLHWDGAAGGLCGLPRTGQTTTSPTANYAVGDDGYYQCGLPKAASGAVDNRVGTSTSATRFVDNGDGTITDNMTGLMWVADPATDIGSPFDAAFGDWPTAMAAVATLNGAGGFATYTDWRPPNLHEMESLHDAGQNTPALPTEITLPNEIFWTSTTLDGDSIKAYGVTFAGLNGNFGLAAAVKNAPSGYLVPVRGGIINQNG